MKKFLLVAPLLASVAFAAPAIAMTDAECSAAFKTADKNNDGMLSEAEAARYFAAMRVASKSVMNGSISQADFMSNCKADVYMIAKTDPAAPLPGSNSFTENQAKDRVLAAGFTSVSELKKDDKRIWRGTASHEAKSVNIAIDYKGNVVAN